MIIREYQVTDHDMVIKLHREALELIGTYKGDGPWDNDLSRIEKVYDGKNGLFLVGEENGKIVAMGAFRKIGYEVAEIKRMRVCPSMQGKGVGKIMYEALEERAKQMGFKKLHLEANVQQYAAQKLYKSEGFMEMARLPIDGFDCILYEKPLC
jgi:ribosomal protein S18 acetylase RimI-like enzyme